MNRVQGSRFLGIPQGTGHFPTLRMSAVPLGYQIASSKRAVSTCGQATRPPRDHVRADGRLGDGLLPAADYYKDDPAGECQTP